MHDKDKGSKGGANDKPHEISFEISPEDSALLDKIADRAQAVFDKHKQPFDRLAFLMDVTACHANACALDFKRLLTADNFTFLHDLSGIGKNLDRNTGQLLNHFLPRLAKRQN